MIKEHFSLKSGINFIILQSSKDVPHPMLLELYNRTTSMIHER